MADVKREQELAEKRKNDPQLDLAQDHLVRKIFSKFRKPSDGVPSLGAPSRPGSSAPHSSDVEKGPDKPKQAISEPESRIGSAMKVSKWAAALANTSAHAAQHQGGEHHDEHRMGYIDKQTSDREDQNLGAVRRTELVCKKSEHIHVVKDIRPPTQGNKWPRVATSGSIRHDTIEESAEDEPRHATTTTATATPTTTKATAQETADSNKVLIQPKSINSVDYQQIVATLVDMRIDLKLEIQKLTNKIGKIDEHVSNITKKLTSMDISIDEPAPASSAASSQPSAFGTFLKSKPLLSQTATIEEVDEEACVTPTSKVPPVRLDSATKVKSPTEQKPPTATSHRSSRSSGKTATLGRRSKPKTSTVTPVESKPEATDEMRAILENEIAEQQDTDDDQDLTSKL